ncbi:hypothetical protein MJO28_006709 [Puccinia striiformis f. sp. tritici]|uniref:Uncharacterized protein n=1 Tax=Puccinia striiformis f. sp. tritici TaxID=168172 RepID=A0ACC0EJG4_9BASI|nr:hypothetical protein MJO28_006709 [Puccinia striiformis f. sp. tritici]
MPGGSSGILLLQKVFWGTGIFSIIFIGAFLLALLRSGHKKHPVIIGFLITSWVTAWIALLPFFGNYDSVLHTQFVKSMLFCYLTFGQSSLGALCKTESPQYPSPRKKKKKKTRRRADILIFFGLAFVLEVMRMLLELFRFSNIDAPESPEKTIASSFRRKGSVDSNFSEHSYGSYASGSPTIGSLESTQGEGQSLRSNQSVSRKLKKVWMSHWKKSIIILPFFTALPCLFMVFDLQSSMGWRYVHGEALSLSDQTILKQPSTFLFSSSNFKLKKILASDQFICTPPDALVRRKKALIMLFHLVPTSGLGNSDRIPPTDSLPPTNPIECLISSEWFNRGLIGFIPSLYLISFPLISAILFVDKQILKEWKSWVGFGKK